MGRSGRVWHDPKRFGDDLTNVWGDLDNFWKNLRRVWGVLRRVWGDLGMFWGFQGMDPSRGKGGFLSGPLGEGGQGMRPTVAGAPLSAPLGGKASGRSATLLEGLPHRSSRKCGRGPRPGRNIKPINTFWYGARGKGGTIVTV